MIRETRRGPAWEKHRIFNTRKKLAADWPDGIDLNMHAYFTVIDISFGPENFRLHRVYTNLSSRNPRISICPRPLVFFLNFFLVCVCVLSIYDSCRRPETPYSLNGFRVFYCENERSIRVGRASDKHEIGSF